MKKIIVGSIGVSRQITAEYNPKFKSVRFEEVAIQSDGSQYNVSRITLRKEDVQAMLAYFEELEE